MRIFLLMGRNKYNVEIIKAFPVDKYSSYCCYLTAAVAWVQSYARVSNFT